MKRQGHTIVSDEGGGGKCRNVSDPGDGGKAIDRRVALHTGSPQDYRHGPRATHRDEPAVRGRETTEEGLSGLHLLANGSHPACKYGVCKKGATLRRDRGPCAPDGPWRPADRDAPSLMPLPLPGTNNLAPFERVGWKRANEARAPPIKDLAMTFGGSDPGASRAFCRNCMTF